MSCIMTVEIATKTCNLLALLCFCIIRAILRPGRLDMHITVQRPDLKGREEIFKQYLRKVKHDPSKGKLSGKNSTLIIIELDVEIKVLRQARISPLKSV